MVPNHTCRGTPQTPKKFRFAPLFHKYPISKGRYLPWQVRFTVSPRWWWTWVHGGIGNYIIYIVHGWNFTWVKITKPCLPSKKNILCVVWSDSSQSWVAHRSLFLRRSPKIQPLNHPFIWTPRVHGRLRSYKSPSKCCCKKNQSHFLSEGLDPEGKHM